MLNSNIYSCRRRLLDKLLFKNLSESTSNILDIGGKRFNYRGKFSSTNLSSFVSCINPDCSVLPDYVGEITDFDFPKNSFDTVLCLETLEYVLTPEKLLFSIWQVLSPGGYLYLSVPFMHRLHGDDLSDMFRFTPSYLKHILRDFRDVQIIPMGGALSVCVDFIISSKRAPFLLKLLLSKSMKFILLASLPCDCSLTTGYFIIARKP